MGIHVSAQITLLKLTKHRMDQKNFVEADKAQDGSEKS